MNENWKDQIAKHGPWAMLAAVLLYVILVQVNPAIATIQAEHREMRAESVSDSAAMKNVMGQVLMAIERSNYLERRNCINTAKSQTDREACAKDREDQ